MSDAVRALLQLAMEAKRANRLSEAASHLTEAIAMLRLDASRVELAQALRELGEIERHLPDNPAARKHYEEAVAIFRESGETLRLAHTVRHLGDIHHDDGRADLAEPCYQEALALYRRHENTPPAELANAIRPLGVLKAEIGDARQSIALLREARDLYERAGVIEGVAGCSARLALLARQIGDIEQSRQWLDAAMTAVEISGDADLARFVHNVKSQIDG